MGVLHCDFTARFVGLKRWIGVNGDVLRVVMVFSRLDVLRVVTFYGTMMLVRRRRKVGCYGKDNI